jgi:hypothetical protein
MLQRLVETEDAVLLSLSKLINAPECSTMRERLVIKDLIKLLEPFECATIVIWITSPENDILRVSDIA